MPRKCLQGRVTACAEHLAERRRRRRRSRWNENQLHSLCVGGSDRDECYHDEDAESIDEDVVDEMRRIYDEILEKKVPTYPYENYPDLSLGEFVSAEFEQYLQMKMATLDQDEIDERRKVLHWLNKQHPHLTTLAANKLTDVSVQGKQQ